MLFSRFRFIQSALSEHTCQHLANRLLSDCYYSNLRLSSVRINCCFQGWPKMSQNWGAYVFQLRSTAHL